ncbi:MAG: hypothetical protein JWM93_2463 [Frankiales bacterium]|nr:hypothetical protein [Frankiales bacterium]
MPGADLWRRSAAIARASPHEALNGAAADSGQFDDPLDTHPCGEEFADVLPGRFRVDERLPGAGGDLACAVAGVRR